MSAGYSTDGPSHTGDSLVPWAIRSASAGFGIRALARRLARCLSRTAALLGLLRQARGQLAGGIGDFAAQLQVVRVALRGERAGLDRRTHRTAWFAFVPAIAELAFAGQR